MKFRITDLFKSRNRNQKEVKHTPKETKPHVSKSKTETPEIPKHQAEGTKTRKSNYSHRKSTYSNIAGMVRWGSSTKNQSQLNLKYRSKRRKKNRKARQQRAINRKAA